MAQARYFLAHARQDNDFAIDMWTKELTVQLSRPDWPAKVTPGRDDYSARSSALGGWKAWCADVPKGEDYRGEPMFHGVVVPVADIKEATVGRATSNLVEGFLDAGKHVFAWCPHDQSLVQVTAIIDNSESDNWKSWSFLIMG